MNWKPIYAILLLFSTLITYFSAIIIEKKKKTISDTGNGRNASLYILLLCLIVNLGILFLFKYYNFVNENVFSILGYLGVRWPMPNFDLLLPVGISFYTFIALGYIIDVYKGRWKAEKNIITYALFVSFFPQLLSGPISRAHALLPQFYKVHKFKYKNLSEGVRIMLWGYFMKLCVADVISEYVNATFDNISQHSGPSLMLGAFFFSIQIYCDFAGYSNIAIGAAKVMGYDLMENFKRPYLSLSMKEFWKRWHISLSSWFMDYVYIPLGGNRCNIYRHSFNLIITFVVSGIWHGANWTFTIWGAYHGLLVCIDNIAIKYYSKVGKRSQRLNKCMSIVLCFILSTFGWIFFRANNVDDAFSIISRIFMNSGSLYVSKLVFLQGSIGIFLLLLKDVKDEYNLNLNFMHSKNPAIRYFSVIILTAYILTFGALNGGSFIYFQF